MTLPMPRSHRNGIGVPQRERHPEHASVRAFTVACAAVHRSMAFVARVCWWLGWYEHENGRIL